VPPCHIDKERQQLPLPSQVWPDPQSAEGSVPAATLLVEGAVVPVQPLVL